MLKHRTIIIFTERHSAAGCPDNGDFRFEPGIGFSQFSHRRDHHVRCPMKTGIFAAVVAVAGQADIRDLSCGLAAATGYVKAGNCSYAISALLEALGGLLEAKTEGSNNTRGDDGNAGPSTCSVRHVKTPHAPSDSPAILVAFPIDAFYTMSPKGENSSLEVRRLSHGKQSAAI